MIICLETATPLCSVALCNDTGVITLKESDESKTHAAMITVYIDEILKQHGIKVSDLEAVAVSKGPGSYTGLRIGVSVAKGLAFGAEIPLIGVETTLSMFNGIKMKDNKADNNTLYCPMLDARRMEVYYAVYDNEGNKIKDISAEIITKDTFNHFPESKKIIFFGDGALKCKDVIARENAVFDEDFVISAAYMYKPASEALKAQRFEDVAYFEPFYLKDFITTVSTKNVFGNKPPAP
jgi:tRNA threonylcarbamoyladenosine biosynthesis protein TsaB